uniref:Uncharacterized protein n=1 Tax=Anopheles farauti TaxID=69004 RepID=A0A182Q6I0_9DIPT
MASLSRRTLCTSADNLSSRLCKISIIRSRFISSCSNRSTIFASGRPLAGSSELRSESVESSENRLSSPTGTDPIVHGLAPYSSSLSGHRRIASHWLPSCRCSAITSAKSFCCSSASFCSRLRRNVSSSRSLSAFGFIASFSRILRFNSTMKLFWRSSFCLSFANRFDCWIAATEADKVAAFVASILRSVTVRCERLQWYLLVMVHLDEGLPFGQRANHVRRLGWSVMHRRIVRMTHKNRTDGGIVIGRRFQRYRADVWLMMAVVMLLLMMMMMMVVVVCVGGACTTTTPTAGATATGGGMFRRSGTPSLRCRCRRTLARTLERKIHPPERPLGHVQHLDDVPSPGTPHIRRLFRLPRQHADGKEQEKAREKHGKEHKQMDVQLVLAEKHQPVAGGRPGPGTERDVELRLTERVHRVRQRDDQPVFQTKHSQQRFTLPERDVRDQIARGAIVHVEVFVQQATANGRIFLARLRCVPRGLNVERMQLFRDRRREGKVGRDGGVRLDPHVAPIEQDVVVTGGRVRLHDERLVRGAHVEIELTLRHIDDEPYVDVHVPGLDYEKHRLAGFERLWLNFAFI